MHLKLLQNKQFKNEQKQMVIKLVIKLLIKLQQIQEIHNKIIQSQLQMSMIKKYLKKDMYLQMKDRKLFIIYESYNGIIMVYQKIMNLLDKHQINRLIYDKKLGLNK